jgi:hypothetical protein
MATLNLWRTKDGYVVSRGTAATSLPGSLPLRRAAGQPLPEPPSDHYVLTQDGSVAKVLETTVWSVDDELGASVFFSADGVLWNLCARERSGDSVDLEETPVVTGLLEIPSNDTATRAFVEAAMQRFENARRDQAAAAALVGRQRLAAIPGALDDQGVGDGFRRAQEALAHRVEAHCDELAAELLRLLIAFGVQWRSMPDELSPALDVFASACRVAAFDRRGGEDRVEASAVAPDRTGVRSPALAGLDRDLRATHQLLLDAADGQECVDALLNAAAFRRAAVLIAKARQLLPA